MSLLVQKFGGTSVASVEHIERVAKRVISAREAGDDVVVVVSAMGDSTDRLVDLADQVAFHDVDGRREIDVLLSTGEQVTIALLALTLKKHGCLAESFTGRQAGIKTDAQHARARILDIDDKLIKKTIIKSCSY